MPTSSTRCAAALCRPRRRSLSAGRAGAGCGPGAGVDVAVQHAQPRRRRRGGRGGRAPRQHAHRRRGVQRLAVSTRSPPPRLAPRTAPRAPGPCPDGECTHVQPRASPRAPWSPIRSPAPHTQPSPRVPPRALWSPVHVVLIHSAADRMHARAVPGTAARSLVPRKGAPAPSLQPACVDRRQRGRGTHAVSGGLRGGGRAEDVTAGIRT